MSEHKLTPEEIEQAKKDCMMNWKINIMKQQN